LVTTTASTRTRPAVRPLQQDDLAAVFALYERVFGTVAARAFRSRWQWAQKGNPAGEARRWVLTSGGQVVGSVSALPVRYRLSGNDVVAHTPADFMVDPQHRFHGVRLLQTLFEACPSILSFDDIPATVKVTRWLGANEVGRLVRYVKVLDARYLRDRRGWRSLPPPLLWAATRGLQARAALRWSPLRVEAATGFDRRFDALLERLPAQGSLASVRDRRTMEWRYGPSGPHPQPGIGVLAEGPRALRGYVVFQMLPSRTGAVFHLETADTADGEAAAALLHHATERLRRLGAWAVKARRLEPGIGPPAEAYRKAGFVPRGGHHVLARLPLHDVDPALLDIQYGDTEASHGEH
jgi:hypothetical protein